jgi:hypothetical protein
MSLPACGEVPLLVGSKMHLGILGQGAKVHGGQVRLQGAGGRGPSGLHGTSVRQGTGVLAVEALVEDDAPLHRVHDIQQRNLRGGSSEADTPAGTTRRQQDSSLHQTADKAPDKGHW